jgi:hypothetical protein
MIHNDLLAQAKQHLPLTALMAQLGLSNHAKKSARCPFHEDASASFSLYVGDDGEEHWKCFAGCGQGDAIDFLAQHRGLSNADAYREYIHIADVTPPLALPPRSNPSPSIQPPFDWQSCVAALTPAHRADLAKWRGYAPKFVEWLHAQNLVGLFGGERIAFPVHDAGRNVIGCHYRRKEDDKWRYHPTGTHAAPYIIGDLATAKIIHAFESQWDLLALADRLHHHKQPLAGTAFIATRGASNAHRLVGLCAADAVMYAFSQNDAPGQKWLATVAANCGCKCHNVVTPAPHKDVNDWTRAGASRPEIEAAIAIAQPVAGSDAADLPEEPAEPEPVPFPIECLPPDMAGMVCAVAKAHQVPESMPGLMALALVPASIGKGMVLDWRPGKAKTPANFFALLTATSGSGKTECAKQLAAPFLNFETDMQESWSKNIKPKLQADLRFHEIQLKKLDRKLIKESTSAADSDLFRAEQVFHQSKVDELKGQLHEPKLSIADATVEKVATVLQQNDQTICSISSDARKLCDNLLGRYSANKKLADDSIYLCAYSGDQVTVDRQGREGVRLPNPNMTLLWALQPDALEMLLDEDSLQQGGFLARCLIAHTHAEPQHIGGDSTVISDDVRNRWETLIRTLLIAHRQPLTLPGIEPKTVDTYTITATIEARQRLEFYFNEIVDRRKSGELTDVSQYASRWCEHAARIAITLHAGLHGATAHQQPLVLETAENAVALAKWFANQQLGLLAKGRHAASTKVEDAVLELLETTCERKAQDFITARDVLRARITSVADAATALLARMEADGLLGGEDKTPAHGGKTTRIYRAAKNPSNT